MADTSPSSEILLSPAITTALLIQIRRAADAGLTRLAKGTGRYQLTDLRFVVAKDAFEHVLIILSQGRSSPPNSGRSAGEFRARTLDSEFSEARMIERDEMAAMHELRITIRVGAVLH